MQDLDIDKVYFNVPQPNGDSRVSSRKSSQHRDPMYRRLPRREDPRAVKFNPQLCKKRVEKLQVEAPLSQDSSLFIKLPSKL